LDIAERPKRDRTNLRHIVFIPSVSGGLGHVTRTLRLARAMEQLQSNLSIEYVLDQERLRASNLAFVQSTGYPVKVLPIRSRDARNVIVQAMLGPAHLIVDDTYRHLIPLRRLLGAAWASIPMYPLGDELFMDWPLLAQTDRILWAYPPVLGLPEELKFFGSKVTVTGPILGSSQLPTRQHARRQLGFADEELVVAYAPRGMPFGRDFGERLLGGLVNGIIALRERQPNVKLVLTGVRDPKELRFPGMPDDLSIAEGIDVRGILPFDQVRALNVAADVVVGEGTSTVFETIAAGTPLLMVPGPIYETWLIGTHLYEADAAVILWTERVTAESMAEHLERILSQPQLTLERAVRAKKFLGDDGTEHAAQILLELLEKRT